MNDQATLVATLASTWFATGLAPAVSARLAALARPVSAPAGTVILREGEGTDLLGVVITGRVALRTLVPERGEATILTVEPGDIYGWSALVPPYRATSTAVAIEPLEAIVFPGTALRAALHEDPALAAALYPRVLLAVSRRLTATRLQLLDLYAAEQVRSW